MDTVSCISVIINTYGCMDTLIHTYTYRLMYVGRQNNGM